MRRQNDGLRTENAELVSRTTELVDRLAAIKAEREDLADRLTRAEVTQGRGSAGGGLALRHSHRLGRC